MINGKRYAWEDVTITLPHGVLVDVEKIDYGDEKDFKAVYGKGSKPRAYGGGNYKAEGKLTLLREEFEKLLLYCRTQGVKELYGLPPFPITVSFANEDEPTVTDVLQQCKFTKTGTSAEQGSEKTTIELDILILGGIEWNGLQGAVLDAIQEVT